MEQNEIVQYARIRSVGIGPLGAEMVQILSQYMLDDIICHEVVFNQNGEASEEMAEVISLVRESDLLFILSGFEEDRYGMAALAVGRTAREAGVLTFAIVPDYESISQQIITELTEEAVAVLPVSERSLTDERDLTQEKMDELTGYVMCHIVTRLTNLICYRSIISTYGVHREATLQKGCICQLGVGVATGPAKGKIATILALKRLGSQGLSILDAVDLTVIVESSSHSNTDDWNDVCEVIRNNVVEGTPVLISLEMNELLGFSDEIKVSVMAVR